MRAAFSMIPEPAQPHLRGDFWALPGRLEDVPAPAVGQVHCCDMSGGSAAGRVERVLLHCPVLRVVERSLLGSRGFLILFQGCGRGGGSVRFINNFGKN